MPKKPTYEELEQRVLELEKADSKRKHTEHALRESEERFRKLFQKHSAVNLIIDPDTGNIIDANEAALKFYGWSIEELRRMSIQQINLLPPEAVITKMQEAASIGSARFEFQHQRADGSICDIEVFSNKLVIAGRGLLYSIIHDITDRKLAEQSVLDSENRFRAAFMGKSGSIIHILSEKRRLHRC